MGLFSSNSSERQRQRERKRRQKARAKLKKQQEYKEKEAKKSKSGKSAAGKTIAFINSVIDLFSPTKSRTSHNRLIQNGSVFGLCSVLLLLGYGVSAHAHSVKEAIRARTQTFTATNLAFSKTQTEVSTKAKPFMTQDHKTVYIPFFVKNASQVDVDASKYHIVLMPYNQSTLTYHPVDVQLVSYGSSGHMFLIVKSSDKIQSQTVQFLLWSGSKLTDDSYNPTNDTSNTSIDTLAIKRKYDTLAFTINLGGSSVDVINKDQEKQVKEKVTHYNKKTKKKTSEVETKTITVPDPDGQYLYSNRKLAYIYNRIYAHKDIEKLQRRAKSYYSKLDIAISNVQRNWGMLNKSGYKMPKLPDWASNNSNNLADGLPLNFKQIQDLKLMDDPFIKNPNDERKINLAMKDYIRTNQDNDDSDDGSSDDDSSNLENQIQDLKEYKTVTKWQNMTLSNKGTGQKIEGTSTNDQGSNPPDQSSVSEWQALINAMEQVIEYKHQLYYTNPINIYQDYQTFLRATSSGSKMAQASNTGAITFSKTSGYNKHGKFMSIIGVPTSSK